MFNKIFGSILIKFNIMAITFITILLAISTFTEFKIAEKQWHEVWENSLFNSSNSLSISLPSALWNFQEDDINAILQATVNNNDIDSIFIQEKEKTSYGVVQDTNLEYISSTELPEFLDPNTTKTIDLYHPDAGDEVIATVVILTNSTSLDNALLLIIQSSIIKIIILDLIMAAIIYLFVKLIIINPIKEIANTLKDISQGEGDLTNRIEIKSRNEIGYLGIYFNLFIEKLHKSMTQVDTVAITVNELAGDLQELSNDSKDIVSKQDQEMDMVAAAITQMSATANEVSNNTTIVAESAHNASQSASEGRALVTQAVEIISDLSNQIDEATTATSSLSSEVGNIVSVLNVIKGIAEQTNLLALNAAIEAARAGEQGRGFAVVADEVRALAARTQDSTVEIQKMIENLESSTAKSVKIITSGKELGIKSVEKVNLVNQSLQDVFKSIEAITDMTDQIASSVKEQTHVSEEISVNVNHLSDLSSTTFQKVESSAVKSTEVHDQADHLLGLLKQFKL
ncbi:MAG: methyl-accepting chemotaxis protein [Saccharospirillaceae bacterium]|nr:methyl-accepting chemotaxis protein [Pseudomonadales bacterium]NRB79815.1 methyl-accepting chemotaxis protein [Saccharospirillaceae bacterium]